MADFDFIMGKLKTKSSTKQLIYKTTCDVFTELKNQLQLMQKSLGEEMEKYDKNVEIKYSSHGNFEVHLKFSGDTLVFMMHTNVFNFDDNQYIHRTDYVKEDPMRSYCGLIQIYNFLSDSIKYNRLSDVGYLIGRLYINK
jgi:hypothetical protein